MNRLERYTDTLFLVFLFLLPFQTVYLFRESLLEGQKWQYGTIGIYVSAVVLALAMIIGMLSKSREFGSVSFVKLMTASWKKPWIDRLSILLVGWAGLSALWAFDRSLALEGFLTLSLAMGAFVMARSMVSRGVGDRIVTLLILSGVIQAGIGVSQFLLQETFASTLLGTSAHPVWQAGTSVLKLGAGRFLRAYGTFPHPNVYGLFVAVGLFLTIVSLSESHGKRTESRNRTWERIGLVSAIPVLCLGLLVSFSRIAWGGFALGILAYAFPYIRQSFRSRHGHDSGSGNFGAADKMIVRYVMAGIAAAVLSVLVFSWALSDVIFPRFDGTVIARERSVTDRLTTYRDAWIIIGKSPLFGTGIWNSTAERIRLDPVRPVWEIQPAHDVPLLVLSELGIPGLILLVVIAIRFVRAAYERKNIAAFTMFLVLFPSLLLDHFLWTSNFGMLFLFATFGLNSKIDRK